METAQANFFLAIQPFLPEELAKGFAYTTNSENVIVPAAEDVLDNLMRLLSGAECSSSSSDELRGQWKDKQRAIKDVLDNLTRPHLLDGKRPREDGTSDTPGSPHAKRQRLSPKESTPNETRIEEGAPLFTLHSVSATSPVRKKVDVTIHKSAIKFTNPSTRVVEASVPLSAIRRAFILPTRSKSKPHWTVVLLSTDIPDKGKPTSASAQENPQVILGIDATTIAPLTTTTYESDSAPSAQVTPKGSATLPFIRELLSHLGVDVLEPSTDVFKSACAGVGNNASSSGIPGIEAYRAAKAGSLWFTKEGILWGESKPCEFWAVEDLIGKTEGLRVVGGTGRTCSVVLTRKSSGADGEVGEDEEDMGEETEFGMVDARERDGISEWVRQHRHLFGKKKVVEQEVKQNGQAAAPVTINNVDEDSDESDEDFEVDSDSSGSDSSDSDSSDSSSDGEGRGSGEEEEDSGEEGEGEGEEDDEGEEEELKAENHPLMRRGAMPRMSRAAIEMAVGLVEQDMVGVESEGEEDELED